MKLKTKLRMFFADRFGCDPQRGIFYKIYDQLAGELYCMCCVFWRGVIFGICLLLVLIALVFGIFIK